MFVNNLDWWLKRINVDLLVCIFYQPIIGQLIGIMEFMSLVACYSYQVDKSGIAQLIILQISVQCSTICRVSGAEWICTFDT